MAKQHSTMVERISYESPDGRVKVVRHGARDFGLYLDGEFVGSFEFSFQAEHEGAVWLAEQAATAVVPTIEAAPSMGRDEAEQELALVNEALDQLDAINELIDDKVATLARYGFDVKLSRQTNYYVRDGSGRSWKFERGQLRQPETDEPEVVATPCLNGTEFLVADGGAEVRAFFPPPRTSAPADLPVVFLGDAEPLSFEAVDRLMPLLRLIVDDPRVAQRWLEWQALQARRASAVQLAA